MNHVVASELLREDPLIFALPIIVYMALLVYRHEFLFLESRIVQRALAEESLVAAWVILVFVVNSLLVFLKDLEAILVHHCTCNLDSV